MANRPALVKQAEVTRYAKAMRAAGVSDFRIDIEPTGRVSIVAGKGDADEAPNPCDRLLK